MEAHLYNAYVVAAMLILYGILFIVLENSPITSSPSIQKVGQISVKTGFLIGVFQLLSLIPGTSRSGSTILGAMILGCSRSAAAEFSFFLGIPVMFGASFLKIVKFFLDGNSFTGSQIFYTLLGMAVAFGVSVYSIQFLMSYVRRHNFKFFGYYRIILGAIVLAYFGITLSPYKRNAPFLNICRNRRMEQKRSIFYLLFNHIGNLIDQAFAFLPAKTGIGDGLSVAVLSDLMAAGLDVAFNHQPFTRWRISLE